MLGGVKCDSIAKCVVCVYVVDSATHSRTRGRSKWIEMSSSLLRFQRSDALHGRDAGCGNHMVRVALVRVVREKFVLLKLRKKGASLSGQEMGEESSHMMLILLVWC